jgi:hypothetical protein
MSAPEEHLVASLLAQWQIDAAKAEANGKTYSGPEEY